jgi:hypothetical protein
MQRRLPGFAAIRARLAGRFLLGTIYLRDFRNRNLAVHRVGRFFVLVALLHCEASAPVADERARPRSAPKAFGAATVEDETAIKF